MSTDKFIREMKQYAQEDAREAARCGKQWEALARFAYAMAVISAVVALAVPMALIVRLLLSVFVVGWVMAGYSNRKQGERFVNVWLKLREEALRNAHDAEATL